MRSRGRQLNVPLIKGVVMALLSLPIALGSGLTGLAAQAAAASTIDFMLGFRPERTIALSLWVSLVAGVAALIAASLSAVGVNLGDGLLLAFCATLGVILTARMATAPRMRRWQIGAQSAVMLLCIYVMSAALRGGPLGPEPVAWEFGRTTAGLVLIGLGCGALGGALQVATGVLLVPALVFLAAKPTAEAIATSLLVVAAASLLPVLSHSVAGHLDWGMRWWMGAGAAAGGALGGLLLARLAQSPYPLLLFGALAMYLSASWLWRNAAFEPAEGYNGKQPPPSPPP